MNVRMAMTNRILPLAENMLEGLEHAVLLIQDGKIEQTHGLMVDVIEGFGSIEDAIPLVWKEEQDRIMEWTHGLRDKFSVLVTAYENEDKLAILDVLESDILPSYRSWLDYLKNNLPLNVS